MARAKAVILTQSATNPQPGYDPEPLVVVGTIPAGAYTVQPLTAVPGTFADEAAVRTYLNTLVTELKASPYFS